MMTQIYKDGTYLSDNPNWHEEDSSWKAGHIKNIIEKNCLQPSSVCEIGCGAGGILGSLARTYPDKDFSGYEISPQAFALCESKATSNLRFFHKDLLQEAIEPFDILLAIDVFEHVEDYFGFLRRLKEKGHYIIFHIPLDLSAQTVLRGSPIVKRRESVGHIHYFTQQTALMTLKDTGYEIVEYHYTNSALELHNRGWKTNLLRTPRKVALRLNADFAVRLFGGFSLLVLAK